MMMTDEQISQKLGALAHPARFAIARMLRQAGPAGLAAGKLGEALDVPANALTFHLQKLANAGLFSSRRDGQYIIYSAVFPELLQLSQLMVAACCADTPEKCGPACSTAGN